MKKRAYTRFKKIENLIVLQNIAVLFYFNISNLSIIYNAGEIQMYIRNRFYNVCVYCKQTYANVRNGR